jgi:hypothetical protein
VADPPVVEMFYDNDFGVTQEFLGLIGASWQMGDTLSFDVALRDALINNRPVNELRARVTFGFPPNLSRPTSADVSGALPLSRR